MGRPGWPSDTGWPGKGRDFVILDQNARAGDAWRQRWDSLHLFTPAKYDGLPGAHFPGDRLAFPSKDELADYFEEYVRRFDLPFIPNVRVEDVRPADEGFAVSSRDRVWHARNVVVATGGHQLPKTPRFATEVDPAVLQLHSQDYRNPGQLRAGPVLIVGLGNSGAEIALEVGRTHPTLVAGKPSGELPVRHGRTAARFALPIVRFLGLYVLNYNTPVGRKAAPGFKSMAAPLIRTKTKELGAAGIDLVPRVAGVADGKPVLEDGRILDVSTIIWCTGYHEDYSWLKLPALDPIGEPRQTRGVAHDVSGLYFIGQEFLFAAASATLPGVSRDARYLARQMAASHTPAMAQQPAMDRSSLADQGQP
ncbi:flavin-containing monooxygenase [Paenarthrobacter sp. NPDC056912]|uniref:flavin-containing monooxygenase n=1 Tax=Paenarthrobacter sp. NPDC056912 TaxID=3345965 RepID=UPI00366EE246